MLNAIIGWTVVVGWFAFFLQCPAIKPWFGFRKPKGRSGKWFE